MVDNNDEQEDDGVIFNNVFKQIRPLANKKPTSKIAMAWIANEMQKKKEAAAMKSRLRVTMSYEPDGTML